MVIWFAQAANLDSRVHRGIDQILKLENKVVIIALSAQKGIGTSLLSGANDHPILNLIGGIAPALDPAVEMDSIEKGGPLYGMRCDRQVEQEAACHPWDSNHDGTDGGNGVAEVHGPDVSLFGLGLQCQNIPLCMDSGGHCF